MGLAGISGVLLAWPASLVYYWPGRQYCTV